jgi:hypothetical protein
MSRAIGFALITAICIGLFFGLVAGIIVGLIMIAITLSIQDFIGTKKMEIIPMLIKRSAHIALNLSMLDLVKMLVSWNYLKKLQELLVMLEI